MTYRKYPPPIDPRTVVVVAVGIILIAVGLYRIA